MASIETRTWTNKSGKTQTRYRVTYTIGGVRKRRDFPRKAEARGFVETLSSVKSASRLLPPGHSGETMAQATALFLEACERGRDGSPALERTTVREYRERLDRHVLPVIGADRLVTSITRDDVIAARDKLLDLGHVRSTGKKHLNLLKGVLHHAIDRGVLTTDPTVRVTVRDDRRAMKAKRERTPIHTKEEMGAILAAASSLRSTSGRLASVGATWRRYEVMLNVLVFAGLRMSELRGLPVDAFSPIDGTLRIYQRADEDGTIGSPKSVHGFRTVHIPASVCALLTAWIEHAKPTGLMFGTKSGRPINHSSLATRMWRKAQLTAGVRVLNPHAARHFYASFLLDQGASLKVLQESLGHHDPMFTMRVYGHLFKGAADIAARGQMADRMEAALVDED